MRRLIAVTVLLSAAVPPIGAAYADSVIAGVRDCHFVNVNLPTYEPTEFRVCRPVGT